MPLSLSLPPLLAQLSIPGLDSGPERPISSVDPSYFELLERNSHVVYPALGVLVLGLVALAIFQTARTEFKRRIVEELRRYPAGLETPELVRSIGLERGKLVQLLNLMVEDGVLLTHITTQQKTVWRVKGVGGRAA
jgi:hypothetical protein